MDNKAWSVDLLTKTATHPSGLVLRFRGRPGTAHFGFAPEWIPQEITCLELARLMRTGVECYAEHIERDMADVGQTLARTG